MHGHDEAQAAHSSDGRRGAGDRPDADIWEAFAKALAENLLVPALQLIPLVPAAEIDLGLDEEDVAGVAEDGVQEFEVGVARPKSIYGNRETGI